MHGWRHVRDIHVLATGHDHDFAGQVGEGIWSEHGVFPKPAEARVAEKECVSAVVKNRVAVEEAAESLILFEPVRSWVQFSNVIPPLTPQYRRLITAKL